MFKAWSTYIRPIVCQVMHYGNYNVYDGLCNASKANIFKGIKFK